jgi:Protein of unknown function (DUF2795)
VERRSTEHSPRVDDALKRETSSLERGAPVEARVREERLQEGPGDYDRPVAARTAPVEALGPDEASARRELSRHLRLSVFPAKRDALVEEAVANRAPVRVVEALRSLPAEPTFATAYEVWEALPGRRS